jgi:hypothetical protein
VFSDRHFVVTSGLAEGDEVLIRRTGSL